LTDEAIATRVVELSKGDATNADRERQIARSERRSVDFEHQIAALGLAAVVHKGRDEKSAKTEP